MPFVIAGLTWLFESLAGLLPLLVAWFATWMTKRIAIAAAMVAAFITLTAAFYLTISGLFGGLQVVAPPFFAQACSLILPSNTQACIALYFSTVSARWLYDVQLRVLNYSNPGS